MSFFNGLQQGWGLGNSVMDAIEARDVRRAQKDAWAKSEAEAAQGGQAVDVLPESQIGRGYGVTTGGDNANQYLTRDAGTAGMIAQQEQDIRGMQQDSRDEFLDRRAMRDAVTGRPKDVQTFGIGGGAQAQPPAVNPAAQVSRQGYTAPGGAFAARKEDLPGYGMQTQMPKMSAAEIYHKKYAPAVYNKLVSQNRLKEAEAFSAWSRDQRNQGYQERFAKVLQAVGTGDMEGAAMLVQDLYNSQVDDGNHAVFLPNKDGSYTGQIRNTESGKVVREFKGSLEDLVTMSAGALSPENQVNLLLKRQAKESKTLIVPPGGAVLQDGQVIHQQPMRGSSTTVSTGGAGWKEAQHPDGTTRYWRQDAEGNDVWGPAAPVKTTKTTTRSTGGGGKGGRGKSKGLTEPQRRTNAEIEAARARLAPHVASGARLSELAEVDDGVKADLAMAKKRLYGEDPEFDRYTQSASRPPARNLAPLIEFAKGRDPAKVRESARKMGWREDEINKALGQ